MSEYLLAESGYDANKAYFILRWNITPWVKNDSPSAKCIFEK